MRIRHISIKNFRGIKKLDWNVNGDFICFIGPGDSTKSTILDAIEYALFPRYNIPIEDSDFYNLETDKEFEINVTVGQLPDILLSEQKHGLCLRGWKDQHGLQDEPDDECDLVLTISLQVTKDMEPKWLISNDRLQEEKRISQGDRAILCMSRLGTYVNKHLSWSPGSLLATMTGEDVNLNHVLIEAVRKIRESVDLNSLDNVVKVLEEAEKLGKSVGVVPKDSLKAHIDIKKFSIRDSGVALHDGNVPLRLSGTGTQRLMGLALQLALVSRGGINLIDEIEYGLEPHRICQILSVLKTKNSGKGQVFLTTHSPCVLQELDIANLRIVYSENGETTVHEFKDDSDDSLQRLVRLNPFAFLAKRIIICEGKTEEGILRGMDTALQKDGKRGMWSYGVVSVSGEGDNSFNIAKKFNSLKYNAAWWGDSDVDLTKQHKEELTKLQIPIFDWEDKVNLEQRLFLDLPWEGVKGLVALAIDLVGPQSIKDQLNKSGIKGFDENIDNLKDSKELRESLGKVAHEKRWFKNISSGEKVGTIIYKNWPQITNADLFTKITAIRNWIEMDEQRPAASCGK